MHTYLKFKNKPCVFSSLAIECPMNYEELRDRLDSIKETISRIDFTNCDNDATLGFGRCYFLVSIKSTVFEFIEIYIKLDDSDESHQIINLLKTIPDFKEEVRKKDLDILRNYLNDEEILYIELMGE